MDSQEDAPQQHKRVKLTQEERHEHNLLTQRRYDDKYRDKIIA
jgi:hypothetical protein